MKTLLTTMIPLLNAVISLYWIHKCAVCVKLCIENSGLPSVIISSSKGVSLNIKTISSPCCTGLELKSNVNLYVVYTPHSKLSALTAAASTSTALN